MEPQIEIRDLLSMLEQMEKVWTENAVTQSSLGHKMQSTYGYGGAASLREAIRIFETFYKKQRNLEGGAA